ncbi:MAG TPA: hypothetical protein VFY15_04560 [Acidimicrobiia bacterium]|nr:hypothetical protein [Acidimicrobiia bacterium]
MHRVRVGLALVLLALTLGVAPAVAQDTTGGDGPAVVVQDAAPPPADEAWTFRFLVPTVLAVTGLALAATVLGYAARRRRYRLVR